MNVWRSASRVRRQREEAKHDLNAAALAAAKNMLNAIDLYCGGGGSTTGAEQSGRVKVRVAVNHWPLAIETHKANHPHVRHLCARIEHVDPLSVSQGRTHVLLASPECTHHSIARGGRPMDDQRRAGGWDVVKWVEALRPDWLIVENVREWLNWGPLGCDNRPLKSKRGEFFTAWVNSLRAANYSVEWRLLNAADFGEATSRTRLFVLARRGCGQIRWPAPTHSRSDWRPAASIIDWQRRCPSIFSRKRPLADKTLRRIEIGLRRFVEPFIVYLRGQSSANSIRHPLTTITSSGAHHGIAIPFLVPNFGERDGQVPRTHSVADPLPAVTSHGAGQLATPFLADVNHGDGGKARGDRVHGVNFPLPTVTAHNGKALIAPFLLSRNSADLRPSGRVLPVDRPLPTVVANGGGPRLVTPFITEYYGTATSRSVDEPLSTVTARHRHGLAMVSLLQTMSELHVADIGFRMLDVDELALAQGFPNGYILCGNKAEQTRQVGNAVPPAFTRAICGAIAA